MTEPDRDTDRDARGDPAAEPRPVNWGIAFDLGVRLGISVILGLGGGLLLDSWLRSSPIFTLIGMVLGIGAAMYTIWDVARDAMRR
ncbi:MAG TPA: AtpZ/AtpI family protein [Candidatus Dormibacteraeota bacterium]|nr:AtpZ/AtpI family protein [Candidatus Dormibacteraeota bacterium]